jgi:NADH dehydrogenase FAD-containing subunit
MAARGRAAKQSGSAEVVVLGGGFAGLAALRSLPPRFRTTLVDERPTFEFLPNIHELISGLKSPELLRLPLRPLVRRAKARFVQGRVSTSMTARAAVGGARCVTTHSSSRSAA